MPDVARRTFTASDLASSARRDILELAARDVAHVRATSGEALVMMREASLDHIASIRDCALSYLQLDNALTRPRSERRPADFGAWAFIEAFDDDDIAEFQIEMNGAISRAASGEDLSIVEGVLADWRRSARTLADPVAREILSGTADTADWVDVADR